MVMNDINNVASERKVTDVDPGYAAGGLAK